MRTLPGIVRSFAGLAVVTGINCTNPPAQAQQQRPADLIVANARVHTMDQANPQSPPPTAFAIADGKFIAVGSDAELAAHQGANTRVIDAQGRTIIPG